MDSAAQARLLGMLTPEGAGDFNALWQLRRETLMTPDNLIALINSVQDALKQF